MTFAPEDKKMLEAALPYVTKIIQHPQKKYGGKINTIVRVTSKAPASLIESATLPCKCGQRHPIIHPSLSGCAIHTRHVPKLTPKCEPVYSIKQIIEFIEQARPELKHAKVQTKSVIPTFHYEAEEPQDVLFWAKHHRTKTYKPVDKVKASRAHTVQHRASGLTESERAIYNQMLVRDYPHDVWIHHKSGGTPDWILEHRITGEIQYAEGKMLTDQLERTKQLAICLALRRKHVVNIYGARKVRDTA